MTHDSQILRIDPALLGTVEGRKEGKKESLNKRQYFLRARENFSVSDHRALLDWYPTFTAVQNVMYLLHRSI